jgi:hypothetical protein
MVEMPSGRVLMFDTREYAEWWLDERDCKSGYEIRQTTTPDRRTKRRYKQHLEAQP